MRGPAYTRDEDRILRDLAGTKTADEIGLILGRTRHSVHHRINRLGLKGHLHGEHHWNAKVDGLRISMLHTLLDAGFAPSEVHRMFDQPLGLSYKYITQIACGRHRRQHG